jgi:hypothetical protein
VGQACRPVRGQTWRSVPHAAKIRSALFLSYDPARGATAAHYGRRVLWCSTAPWARCCSSGPRGE